MKHSGIKKLTVTSPVQSLTEPIMLTEAKTYLHLPELSPADTDQDALISGYITAARELAEGLQKRPLVAAQYDLTLDYFPCQINLGDGLESVELVQHKKEDGTETALVDGTDYIVDLVRGLIVPAVGKSWPTDALWPTSAVTVRYTVAAVGATEMVKAGMLRHIQDLFDFGGLLPGNTTIDHEFTERLMRFGAKPVVI